MDADLSRQRIVLHGEAKLCRYFPAAIEIRALDSLRHERFERVSRKP